jgi:hypothetical protein
MFASKARKELADYSERPDVKALAISGASGTGRGMAFGAPDVESAKREALQRCTGALGSESLPSLRGRQRCCLENRRSADAAGGMRATRSYRRIAGDDWPG